MRDSRRLLRTLSCFVVGFGGASAALLAVLVFARPRPMEPGVEYLRLGPMWLSRVEYVRTADGGTWTWTTNWKVFCGVAALGGALAGAGGFLASFGPPGPNGGPASRGEGGHG